MERRALLAASSAGIGACVGGCIGRLGENGDEHVGESEVEAIQREYEAEAEPLAYGSTFLDCPCSADAHLLTRIENESVHGGIELYGFALNSRDDADEFDEGVLHEAGNDDTREFVDETDFEAESLVVLQAVFPGRGTLGSRYVGELATGNAYVGLTSSFRETTDDVLEYETLGLRVEHAALAEPLLVGQHLKLPNRSHTGYAIYTSED